MPVFVIDVYITPNAYGSFRLNSQSGSAAFASALLTSFDNVAIGPIDTFVYPLNTAMVARTMFDSEATAAKVLDVLVRKGMSFDFNGQLVRCNATLPQAGGLRPSTALGTATLTFIKATLKANFTVLGVKDSATYAELQLVTEATVRSALGQAGGAALSEVALRPSYTEEASSSAAFLFSDAAAGASLNSLLAQGGMEISWNNKTYALAW